ncbi:MAG: DUF1592 domain-containing protein, partial [Myxococcota bacterium]
MRFVTLTSLLLAACGTPGSSPPPTVPAACPPAEPVASDVLERRFADEMMPLLRRPAADGGCAECHVPGSSLAMVIHPDPSRTFRELWARGRFESDGDGTLLAVTAPNAPLRMPLGGGAWPDAERAILADFACAVTGSGLDAPPACPPEPDPGFVGLRRLTNLEYDRTIAVALGEPRTFRDRLAPDDLGAGFDTVASAQGFSTPHLMRYAEAAADLAAQTIAVPERLEATFEAEALAAFAYTGSPITNPGHGGARDGYWHFRRIRAYVDTGTVVLEHPGTYTIAIRARGHGGQDRRLVDGQWTVPDPHDHPDLRVDVDGVTVAVHELTSPFEAWGPWEELTFDVVADAGPVTVQVWLDNASWGATRQRNVELDVDWIRLSGPALLPPVDVDRLDRFVVCELVDAACVDATVANALSVLWRRPPTAREVDRYRALMVADGGEAPSVDGVRLVVEAALLSPHFLFRPELDPTPTPKSLAPFELATRLSYFVWSGPPDDALLADAASGRLLSEATLSAQIDRMLADYRADALVDNFMAQWLQLTTLERMQFSPDALPEFDEPLRQAMLGEIRALLRAIVAGDRPLVELVDVETTWVNDRLAHHYGLSPPGSEQPVPVRVAGRGGLLRTAGFLALTSHPAKTSPVRRGRWVLDALLCQPPAEP